MKLLNKLTLKNLKLNPKRTIVTIVGIILSVALLSAVANMFFSSRASLIVYQQEQQGNFHYSFYNVPKENLEKLELNRKIETINVVENIGYAKLEGIQNEYKPYVCVKGYSNEAFQELCVDLIEGRFPKNKNEIIISEHLKTNGGVDIKIGETITLEIGTRMADNFELSQDNPYDEKGTETIVNTKKYEYEVVGVMKRLPLRYEPYSAPGYTVLTYLNENEIENRVDVFLRYTKQDMKHHLQLTANILDVDEKVFSDLYGGNLSLEEYDILYEKVADTKYMFEANENLLMLETGILKDTTLQMLAGAGFIVVLIIIFTSVYCIKNSFDISITEKIRQYGMLSSIGATRKQIKRNVYYEAFILGMIGIPLGILSGIFASFVLLDVTDYLLQDTLGFQMKFSFSWLAILISIILGSITIFLSARSGAKRASKITPIQAIRNSNEIKIQANHMKTPKWVGRFFGIGGEISYKNLQRSKKKYRTTVTSIVVCIMVFITVSSFVEHAFKTVSVQYQYWNGNIRINYFSHEDVEEKFEEIKVLDSIEEISNQTTKTIRFETDKYTKEYLEYCVRVKGIKIPEGQKTIPMEEGISVYILDNDSFQIYAEQLGLNFEEVREKGILINRIYGAEYLEELGHAKQIEMDKYTLKKGDVITGLFDKKDEIEEKFKREQVSISLAAVTDKAPFGMNQYLDSTRMVVGEEYKELLMGKDYHGYIYINSNDATKTEQELQKILGNNNGIQNFEEAAKSEESLFTLIAIFLYGFITVIALIGVTNIFNTITTNMNLRRREFSMLRSIGMTEDEFNRMIQLESFFYGMKSLLIGIPIGCVLSALVYKVMIGGLVEVVYQLPWKAIVISIVAVFFLITIIMKYSIAKINQQNIIETIRNENI